jgi:hypothetical protein
MHVTLINARHTSATTMPMPARIVNAFVFHAFAMLQPGWEEFFPGREENPR